MEFKTLFAALKTRLSDGKDIPAFFRELMAMITTVKEADWGTKKDPSNRVKDSTIRTIAKRGLSQAFAESIVYRLTPKTLTKEIKKRPEACRDALAKDLEPYSPAVNANNVGEIVSDLICESIREAAGIVEPTELIRQKQQALASELKNKYGELLRNEAGDHCPFPGCGRELFKVNEDRSTPYYEVCSIEKGNEPIITNLIALCPECYSIYSIDNDKNREQELRAVKQMLLAQKSSSQLIDSLPLEKGIASVISRIKKLNEKQLEDAVFDPKEIREKLDPAEGYILYKTISDYVSTYFLRIKEIMTNLDKRGEIDYEEIQDQMKAIYRRLKKTKNSPEVVFNQIVEKVHHVTLQENLYCQIVVAYFVQSCEVFDAITK